MPNERRNQRESDSDLPMELAQPARRALIGAGYRRLEQLTALDEAEIKQLHGIGQGRSISSGAPSVHTD